MRLLRTLARMLARSGLIDKTLSRPRRRSWSGAECRPGPPRLRIESQSTRARGGRSALGLPRGDSTIVLELGDAGSSFVIPFLFPPLLPFFRPFTLFKKDAPRGSQVTAWVVTSGTKSLVGSHYDCVTVW